MGRFVEITVRPGHPDAGRAEAVVRACPVDIYESAGGPGLLVRQDRVDECILCGQCVAAGGDAVCVRRAYGTRREVTVAGPGR